MALFLVTSLGFFFLGGGLRFLCSWCDKRLGMIIAWEGHLPW